MRTLSILCVTVFALHLVRAQTYQGVVEQNGKTYLLAQDDSGSITKTEIMNLFPMDNPQNDSMNNDQVLYAAAPAKLMKIPVDPPVKNQPTGGTDPDGEEELSEDEPVSIPVLEENSSKISPSPAPMDSKRSISVGLFQKRLSRRRKGNLFQVKPNLVATNGFIRFQNGSVLESSLKGVQQAFHNFSSIMFAAKNL